MAQPMSYGAPLNQPYGSFPLNEQYGGPGIKGSFAVKSARRRIDYQWALLNIFLPWALFVIIFAACSFSLHYQHPGLVYFVCMIGVLVVVIAVALAFRAWRKKKQGLSDREPSWFMFAAASLAAALAFGVIFGDMNFWYNMQPFYDIENLNSYPTVDPSKDRGQQLMDAGRVYFTVGTRLDLSKAMGFMNLDLYCVAPITTGTQQLSSYDFWAVGVNCCSGASSDFRCGEFNNIHARSGLRLMNDADRPFYRLAVQQAEAAYQIKSEHPLFFKWMQDPVGEVNSYRDDGVKYFLLGIFTHLAFSIFCVVCAVIGFSKMGKL